MNAPRLGIEPLGVAKPDGESWRTTWRVANLDVDPVRVLGAIAPHSQFRGEASLDREIRGKSTTQISLVVRIDAAARAEIENAFVILLIQRGDERWRLLARLRVPLDAEIRPRPRIEAVTVQRVGFSGEL
ncbi:MAG TPA: hypothetical protein VGR85_00410 [Candidatus Limnocylindria bacterium]|nr:hypothetical protein [Candidatus Limnocylindria bacterium]